MNSRYASLCFCAVLLSVGFNSAGAAGDRGDQAGRYRVVETGIGVGGGGLGYEWCWNDRVLIDQVPSRSKEEPAHPVLVLSVPQMKARPALLANEKGESVDVDRWTCSDFSTLVGRRQETAGSPKL